MSMEKSIIRCADAVSLIDNYLLTNQKSGSYNRWLERYKKHPSEHDDAFLFGKLVQAMFSGGMKGKVVDDYMPRMEEAFHGWDVRWISILSEADVDSLAASGRVITHRKKLDAVVLNAKTVLGLISRYDSFGRYLAAFEDIAAMSADLSSRFSFLGKTTTQDFLRNVGFDTAKPDIHLTRWLKRMQAIDEAASPDQVLDMICTIAEAAKLSRAKFDSSIYLFCADRNDVLENGGVCGKKPSCGRCPITALCPRNNVSKVDPPSRLRSSRPLPKKPEGKHATTPKPKSNTVWATTYAGMSFEEVKRVNQFATHFWLDQPFGRDGSWERIDGIENLFAGNTTVDNDRIAELGRNDGKYVAFRAIVHHHAVWAEGVLRRCTKPVKNTRKN